MTCQTCQKEVTPNSFFCVWCDAFIPTPGKGKKANLFTRWFALVIDPLIAIALYFIALAIFGSINEELGVTSAILFPLLYFVWYLTLFRKGFTPGKLLLGLQVVNHQSGDIPGFGKMFVREIVGRFLSGLFLGIGYIWALFDNNSQAWHDKLAGTVVIKKAK